MSIEDRLGIRFELHGMFHEYAFVLAVRFESINICYTLDVHRQIKFQRNDLLIYIRDDRVG